MNKSFRKKKSFLKGVRASLEARRREILESSPDAIDGERQERPGNLPDLADLATSESDHSFSIRLRERERKLLGKIDEAIQRLDDGTYGICDSCGETIGEGRLRARPVTVLCINCKTEQEEEERRRAL
jgi:DnaK suppressor protein